MLAARVAAVTFAAIISCSLPAVEAHEARPKTITKVIEVLGLLKKQIAKDTTSDKQQYTKYSAWYKTEKAQVDKLMAQASQKIESLQGLIKEQDSLRVGYRLKLEKGAAAQAKAEATLKAATARREKELKDFDESESQLAAGVTQFTLAIKTLKKKIPKAAAAALLDDSDAGTSEKPANGTSLLSVARDLREALEKDSDVTLTGSQRETLDELFRQAAAQPVDKSAETQDTSELDTLAAAAATASSAAEVESTSEDDEESDDAALGFLQVRAKARAKSRNVDASSESNQDQDLDLGPYGDYQSQTGSLVNTLASVLKKTKQQLNDARTTENKARTVYASLKKEMDTEIGNKKSEVAAVKMSLSTSEEKSGQMKSQLLAAKQLLKTSTDDEQQLTSDFTLKSANYKERTKKRADEALAVSEAIKILTNPNTSKAFNSKPAAAKKSGKFLQEGKNQVDDDIETAPSFVETRSRVHRHLSGSDEVSADPFSKVKTMLRGMLRKLTGQQNQDIKKGEWCDEELGKSTKELSLRDADVQKLKDRIEEMDAQLDELSDDINTTTKDLGDMRKGTAKAAALRKSEADKSKASLVQYRDAQKILKSAMVALKKFYDQEEGKSGFKQNGGGSAVIGILEVASSDYAKLEEELTLNEKVATKDFNDYMSQSKVRLAAFSKDLEYNTRAKIKTQGDKMRTSGDLKSYQKELDAIKAYLAQLKSSCTIKGDSYSERKAKREKTLESLKSALKFLNGEGMA